MVYGIGKRMFHTTICHNMTGRGGKGCNTRNEQRRNINCSLLIYSYSLTHPPTSSIDSSSPGSSTRAAERTCGGVLMSDTRYE